MPSFDSVTGASSANEEAEAAGAPETSQRLAVHARLIRLRRENFRALLGQFAAQIHAEDPLATGVERRFAEAVKISPTYVSLLKSGGKQVHDKMARQIEVLMALEPGWMDQEHTVTSEEQFIETALAAWRSLRPDSKNVLSDLLKRPDLEKFLVFLQKS